MGIRLNMVGIVTRDMGKALAFYRLLGLVIPEGSDEAMHVEAQTPDGVRLAFDKQEMIADIYGGWEEPQGHRIELAFLCESAQAVDELFVRIVESGHRGHRAPWDAVWGQRYAIVQDPDGNLISLFA